MSLNEKYGYRPYSGGAGPTHQQEADFVALLHRAALAEGLQASLKLVDDEDIEDVCHVAVGERLVAYDRWGYCSADGKLDQASLADALTYFKSEA